MPAGQKLTPPLCSSPDPGSVWLYSRPLSIKEAWILTQARWFFGGGSLLSSWSAGFWNKVPSSCPNSSTFNLLACHVVSSKVWSWQQILLKPARGLAAPGQLIAAWEFGGKALAAAGTACPRIFPSNFWPPQRLAIGARNQHLGAEGLHAVG